MRTYQTLTLIAVIFGIIIGFLVWSFLSISDVGLRSLEENYGDSDTPNRQAERESSLSQITIQAGVTIVMLIIALILVFVLPRHPKIVGVYLLIVSVAVLIGMGLFGILPFALFLPAGIVALRYKVQNDIKSNESEDDGKVYSGGGGGSPLK
jgi:uncharacterized membrane protein